MGSCSVETEVQQDSTSKINQRDFPGGAVVKDPPANAGDMGSSPGLGRSHVPCLRATKPVRHNY